MFQRRTRNIIRLSKRKMNRKTVDERIEALYLSLYSDRNHVEEEDAFIEELNYKDFGRMRPKKKRTIRRSDLMPMRKSTRPRHSSIR